MAETKNETLSGKSTRERVSCVRETSISSTERIWNQVKVGKNWNKIIWPNMAIIISPKMLTSTLFSYHLLMSCQKSNHDEKRKTKEGKCVRSWDNLPSPFLLMVKERKIKEGKKRERGLLCETQKWDKVRKGGGNNPNLDALCNKKKKILRRPKYLLFILKREIRSNEQYSHKYFYSIYCIRFESGH